MCFIPHKEKLMKTLTILPYDSRLKNRYVGFANVPQLGTPIPKAPPDFKLCSYYTHAAADEGYMSF